MHQWEYSLPSLSLEFGKEDAGVNLGSGSNFDLLVPSMRP